MKDTAYIFYREFCDILRDKGIMVFVLFVPLAYPLLYAWVYTNEVVREVPAVVVDECNSARSREFVRKVDASPDVRIVARLPSMAEAREWLMSHEAYGIYRIPRELECNVGRQRQAVIGLYCDMSSMLYYKALLLAATDISLAMNRHVKVERAGLSTDRDAAVAALPVEYEHVRLYNPSGGFASFLIPPVLMLILQQTLLLGIGMQMGRTRERFMGSIIPFDRHYKNPFQIVLGKAAVYFGIYLVMGIYAFACVSRWFQLPVLGSYLTFLRFLVPYLLACIFFAMTLSAFIYRREDCILIFVFLSVPLLFMSGVSWPASAFPRLWGWIACAFPSTFGMNGYVRIATMGCTIADIGTEYRILWMQAIVYFTASCLVYRGHIQKLARCKGRHS